MARIVEYYSMLSSEREPI